MFQAEFTSMRQGCTYRLSFKDNPHWLIGSTMQQLQHRKQMYWRNATKEQRQTAVYQLIREAGYDGFQLIEIGYHYFNNVQQLRQQEHSLIVEQRDDLQSPHCLNIRGAVKDAQITAQKNREQCKKYAAVHKEEQAVRSRNHYDRNKEAIKERARACYAEHKKGRLRGPSTGCC